MTEPTALIAEDEPLLAAALQADLARRWPELRVVAQVADGQAAVERALALLPAVCFLDIRMPELTGLEAAQAIAEEWPDAVPLPLIVFVTAYDSYALAAFEAQAVDYLVKPVEPDRLAACVRRLQQRLADRSASPVDVEAALAPLRALLARTPGAAPATGAAPPRLRVLQAQTGHRVQMVPLADVVYFEAADKYVRVVTADREHLIRTPLKDLLPQLEPDEFWQIHRGTIVRATAIATAERDDSGKVRLTLAGRPETLVASRLYAHRFKGM